MVVARILTCKEFLEAEYVRSSGWEPSYLLINNEKVERVNIIGLIVYEGDNFIVIDDGSGSVYVNTSNAKKVITNGVGTPILVIGSPRRHENHNYVSGEIVSPVSEEWLNYRKPNGEAKIKSEKKVVIEDVPKEILEGFSNEKIVKELLKRLEKPEGIKKHELIREAERNGVSEEETERIIEELLKRGEIFEVSPNVYHLL